MSIAKAAAAAAGIVAAMVVGVPVLVVAAAAGSNTDLGLRVGSVCATTGPIRGLDPAAARNARVVAAVAAARGGRRAAVIAVMTGLTESGLHVLANTDDPASLRRPHQGVGSDHDSLGIFQQRASWGTAAQRMDPVVSTNLFLDRLLAIGGWRRLAPWVAAQAVQRSAYADGSNYRAHLAQAVQITDLIAADAAGLDCDGGGTGDPPDGPVGPYGLPESYTIPPGTTPQAGQAVRFALAQLGLPYVYGAEGPSAYDCSGLTQAAWAAAGVVIPRTTGGQVHAGAATTAGDLAPGDLVFIAGSHGTLASPRHVGLYLGRGLVVQAPHTGDVVSVVTYDSFVSAGVAALRHIR